MNPRDILVDFEEGGSDDEPPTMRDPGYGALLEADVPTRASESFIRVRRTSTRAFDDGISAWQDLDTDLSLRMLHLGALASITSDESLARLATAVRDDVEEVANLLYGWCLASALGTEQPGQAEEWLASVRPIYAWLTGCVERVAGALAQRNRCIEATLSSAAHHASAFVKVVLEPMLRDRFAERRLAGDSAGGERLLLLRERAVQLSATLRAFDARSAA